jgi:hypothetical protein
MQNHVRASREEPESPQVASRLWSSIVRKSLDTIRTLATVHSTTCVCLVAPCWSHVLADLCTGENALVFRQMTD